MIKIWIGSLYCTISHLVSLMVRIPPMLFLWEETIVQTVEEEVVVFIQRGCVLIYKVRISSILILFCSAEICLFAV